jgi:uncharacterized membrane protein
MAADEVSSAGDELTALAARVAELERQVAVLTSAQAQTPVTIRPARRSSVYDTPPPAIAPRPTMPPPPPAPAARSSESLENRLGSQIFNLIGMVAIIVGASWFLKLAIENGWIGQGARVLIGLACGVGLVLWSERFRRKGFAAFSYSLKALGSGILYLALWASFQLYHQLPASVALLAMVLVTAWNGFMAWSQDAELLAAYGLVGGFATPLLLSTGGNHETFLFTYIAAIDLATVLLMRWKPWRRLLLPAFAATVGYFIGWYAEFFETGTTWTPQSTETAAFALLFFAIFALVSLKGFSEQAVAPGEVIVPVLIPLGHAAFVALALYSVLQDSGQHPSLAFVMVALAAVYLVLMRLQATAVAAAMHLAAAVVFLTVAIPLKASGHTLTTAWMVEGFILYWASTRVRAGSAAEPPMSTRLSPVSVLLFLSLSSYVLGLASLAWHWLWRDPTAGFFNRDLAAALIAIAALAATAWLASRDSAKDSAGTVASLLAIDLVALLLTLREVAVSQFFETSHDAFANAEFATALAGLAVLAGVVWISYRMRGPEPTLEVAGSTLVLFNLLTILTVEREIGALWTRSEANLQRSLAISAFLMLYGAVLLAAGFWRRSAFVRWQALLLLLFTIAKVFFYDISGLSQGYRVASFLGLGVVLMAVSFAYQKDWLGLRQPPVASPSEPES